MSSIREIYDNNNVFVVDDPVKTVIIKKSIHMSMMVTEWKVNGQQELEYVTDRQVMSFIKKNLDKIKVR